MFQNVINVAVAVGTTDPIATFDTSTARTLGVEVKNTGANALDALEVWGRFSPQGNYFKLAYQATDFTTPVYPVSKASASPVTLASAASAWLVLDVAGFSDVQIRASAAVDVTTLEFHACKKFST